MRVEEIPEPMVHRTPLLQDGVEFFFCPAFNAKQLLWTKHNVALLERREDTLVIGDQQCVADIEEDRLRRERHFNQSKSSACTPPFLQPARLTLPDFARRIA